MSAEMYWKHRAWLNLKNFLCRSPCIGQICSMGRGLDFDIGSVMKSNSLDVLLCSEPCYSVHCYKVFWNAQHEAVCNANRRHWFSSDQWAFLLSSNHANGSPPFSIRSPRGCASRKLELPCFKSQINTLIAFKGPCQQSGACQFYKQATSALHSLAPALWLV